MPPTRVCVDALVHFGLVSLPPGLVEAGLGPHSWDFSAQVPNAESKPAGSLSSADTLVWSPLAQPAAGPSRKVKIKGQVWAWA